MITSIGFKFESLTFPCGERHIKIAAENLDERKGHITLLWESSEDIIDLLLLVNAMKHAGISLCTLNIPYVPFSRQDRVCNPGEAFSLQVFADLINSCNAKYVLITDPHSDVVTALINNCGVVSQAEVFAKPLETMGDYYLISPDGGSLKKIYELAKVVDSLGVIECSKERDIETGKITKTIVHYSGDLDGTHCIIVDDICDGGKTFIEIAKVLKIMGASPITLMVSHGFFTKGLEVFDNLIDEIYTYKERIK